jgi:hypothetical protein
MSIRNALQVKRAQPHFDRQAGTLPRGPAGLPDTGKDREEVFSVELANGSEPGGLNSSEKLVEL